MSDDFILCEKDGDATRITITRADVGGLISDDMAVEMTGMINDAARTSKYIVMRSEGDDFCLGRDRKGREFSPPKDPLKFRAMSEVVFQFYGAFRSAPIPVVAVVQGRALGFGCALAAVCDITIASHEARFAFPEMGHNIMPTMAMSSLVDRVSRKGVLYLTYSTAEIDADTALAFGLVSRVVPKADLDAALAEMEAALNKAPLAAVKAVKEYSRHALSMSVEAASDFARNVHATVNPSDAMER